MIAEMDLAILDLSADKMILIRACSTDIFNHNSLIRGIVPIDILWTGHARVDTWSQAPMSDNRLRDELFTAIWRRSLISFCKKLGLLAESTNRTIPRSKPIGN